MGFVQGNVLARVHDGRLQFSRDQGATWAEANSSGWSLVERKVIPADAQSYDFVGLNGDVDEAYQISAEVRGGVGSAGGLLSVRPNGLTTNQSGFGIISDAGGAPGPDTRTELFLGYIPVAGRAAVAYGTLSAKTGTDRMMTSQAAVASIQRTLTAGSRWTDTAAAITFLRVFSSDAAGLGIGTVLSLFKRAIPG